jgi:hypothetical protein
MYQPRVKLEFVRLHTPPRLGWDVSVAIDGAEKGKAGSARRNDWIAVSRHLSHLGIDSGPRSRWPALQRPPFTGIQFARAPDIVAIHTTSRRVVVAEVEGASTRQGEQKVYSAAGQAVVHLKDTVPAVPKGWTIEVIIVTHAALSQYVLLMSPLTRVSTRRVRIRGCVVDARGHRSRLNWLF